MVAAPRAKVLIGDLTLRQCSPIQATWPRFVNNSRLVSRRRRHPIVVFNGEAGYQDIADSAALRRPWSTPTNGITTADEPTVLDYNTDAAADKTGRAVPRFGNDRLYSASNGIVGARRQPACARRRGLAFNRATPLRLDVHLPTPAQRLTGPLRGVKRLADGITWSRQRRARRAPGVRAYRTSIDAAALGGSRVSFAEL